MDSWSDKQIKMMRAGGNQKLISWFESHGVTSDQRIAKKYHSPAAELFRERCDARSFFFFVTAPCTAAGCAFPVAFALAFDVLLLLFIQEFRDALLLALQYFVDNTCRTHRNLN